MKTSRELKFIAVLLAITMSFQNCKVYHSQNVTVEEAVLSQKKVKIIANNNDKYFFKKIFIQEDTIYGVTKINSATAKKLDCNIKRCSVNDKMAKIILDKNTLKEIYLQNEKLSKTLTILAPLVVVSVVILIVYFVGVSTMDLGAMELL